MMLKEMYWATEGYLWEKVQSGTMEVESLEQEFHKMMDFWKVLYLKEGE